MTRFFRPVSQQTFEMDRTYWLVCCGFRVDPLVLEVGRNAPDAYAKSRWWRQHEKVDAFVFEVTLKPSLVQRLEKATTPEEARRILDVENRRYLALQDFGEA